jgi:hypothetical protein
MRTRGDPAWTISPRTSRSSKSGSLANSGGSDHGPSTALCA